MFVNMKLSIIESLKYDGYSLHSCQRAISLVLECKAFAVGLTIHIVAFC